MEVISRKAALERGLKFYFTGKPCKRGHIGGRPVKGGYCVECEQLRRDANKEKSAAQQKKRREANPEKVAAYNKRYYEANKEKSAAQGKKYREANPEKVAAYNKQYRSKYNPEKRATYGKQYYKDNKEERKAYGKQHRKDNPEKISAQQKKSYADHKEERAAQKKQHRKDNPAKYAAFSANRRADKRHRTPAWANKGKIETIYQLKEWAQKFTDEPLHVDHIIPMQGKYISGLHIETNLQILTAVENGAKSNKWNPVAVHSCPPNE